MSPGLFIYRRLNSGRLPLMRKPSLFMVSMMMILSMLRSSGQEVSLHASFSRDTILIGDQVEFQFKLQQPAGLSLSVPEFKDSLPGGVEILKTLGIDTIPVDGNRLEITRRYLVTSFDTTEVTVPPLEVAYDKDSLHVRLATSPVALYVKPMPVDTAKTIADIKAPYKAPLTLAEVLPFLIGLLILLAIAWAVYRYLFNRKKPEETKPVKQKPREPAHVIALRGLNKLRDEKLWQKGELKVFYTRLSDILRTYLDHRYEVMAMEMTTSESLNALKSKGFNDKRLFETLRDILRTADLVKFAKYKPLPDKNESVLLDAVVFVNGTREAWNKEASDETGKPEGTEKPETALAEPELKGEEGTDHE
ncbi:MAG: hypothetical protein GXO83_13430 [Chlorobi bacterium]|nr:hypothetical protein [Chlorobiota bacterium]